MKHLKMLLFSSLICFLISGSANAQLCGGAGAETQAQAKAADILDLGEIIADYCVEVDMAEDKAEEEFAEAALDLADCLGEYIGCLDGGGPPEPLECIERVARCNKRALRFRDGIEQKPPDALEHFGHRGQVGEAFVMQAGHQ